MLIEMVNMNTRIKVTVDSIDIHVGCTFKPHGILRNVTYYVYYKLQAIYSINTNSTVYIYIYIYIFFFFSVLAAPLFY